MVVRHFILRRGGIRIYGDLYTPDAGMPVRGVLQFVHGIAEHFGRYRDFAAVMTQNGYAVIGEDHRGHGRSSIDTGFGSFSDEADGHRLVLSDLSALRKKAKTLYPDVPYILIGHSMGSFFVRAMMLTIPDCADAYILSGTAYHTAATLSLGKTVCNAVIAKNGRSYPFTAAMRTASAVCNFPIPHSTTARDFTAADNAVVENALADPYCGVTPSAGLFADMLAVLTAVCAGAIRKNAVCRAPVLLVSGQNDPIGNYGRGVYQTAHLLRHVLHCPAVTVRLYKNARHEVLLDFSREAVSADILAFLSEIRK